MTLAVGADPGGAEPHHVVRGGVSEDKGRAVQVDPMKPMLKPLRSKHLKLKCDIMLSTFCFQIQLALLHQGGDGGVGREPGRAMQVDPMKPTLKPPGIKRLKLKCDELVQTLLLTCAATIR
jgi:hypothetical protein